MSPQKKPYHYDSPEEQKLIEGLPHTAFVREGTMVAFPLCFPGATVPIIPDESRITALDATPEGVIYGGTSGRRTHIFVGMFHGVTGMVFDMKAVENADHCAAVCCGKTKFLACVNAPHAGGRILMTHLQPPPYDLIQEWGFKRPEFDDLGGVAAGEPILHAEADLARERVVGITSRHLFTVDFETGKVRVVDEISGVGRLAVTGDGNIVGRDSANHVWSYDPATGALHRRAFALPSGPWEKVPSAWARDPRNGLLYLADDGGSIYSFDGKGGFSAPLGRAPLTPVGPMAVTFDGRLYGFAGEGIAKMFCYDPTRKTIADLGAAVSVFERRRYGYVFGDAVTGRDGEVIFGEDDDFGHLWLYFPKVSEAGG